MQQGERGGPRHRDGSRAMANIRPTKTLFVINFDPIRTRTRDIERHFEPYGKVLNVRIRRNFAFVQFETQEEATKALECTNMRLVSILFSSFIYSCPERLIPRVLCDLGPHTLLLYVSVFYALFLWAINFTVLCLEANL